MSNDDTNALSTAGWTRRRTLKAMGAATAVGTLAGCGPASSLFGSNKLDADVIVIGAGLSGLNAAILLEDAGLKVQVLEGNSRIGGRVFTFDNVEGKPEAGGTEIGEGYARIRAMMARMGGFPLRKWIESFELPFALHYNGNPLIKATDWANAPFNTFEGIEKNPPAYGPFGLAAPYMMKAAQELKYPDSWLSPEAAKFDITLAEFLRQQGASEQAIQFIGQNSAPSGDADTTSALWQFRTLRIMGMMGSIQGLERITTGMSRLPEAMQKALKHEIALNTKVEAIESGDQYTTVVTKGGKKYRAKYVICTVPLTTLRHIKLDPLPPALQAEAIQQIPYDSLIYAYFTVTKKYWEMDGLPGSIWSTDQRIKRVFRCNATDGSHYLIVHCPESDKHLDDATIQAKALAALNEIRPSTKDALKPAAVANWSGSEWLQGHNPYRKPGQIAKYGNNFADPVGRIHFAGEHTAVASTGMEGAMESAERAVLEILEKV
jgi:monoamine oxidase